MAIEKYWTRQGPIAFIQNGTESGLITVNNVACFKVKQRVVISSDTQPDLQLQIKRIPSLTQIIVGPLKDDKKRNIKNLNLRTDLSAYTVADNATIRAEEQSKVTIPRDDIWQAVYEFEPTVALRTLLVDKVGEAFDEDNPLWTGISDGNNTLVVNSDGSINANIVTSTVGTDVFFTDTNGVFSDTTETQVAQYISGSNNTRITRFLGVAKTFGTWRLYKDTINPLNLRVEVRTSPFDRNGKYDFEIPEILNNTEQLLITFQADRYRNNLLGANSSTFVRLEGSF